MGERERGCSPGVSEGSLGSRRRVRAARSFISPEAADAPITCDPRRLQIPCPGECAQVSTGYVDQDNDRGRGHQVRQMASIHSEAQRVTIWLGLATPDTDFIMLFTKQLEKTVA